MFLEPIFHKIEMLLLGFSSDHELRNIEIIWYTNYGIMYPEVWKVVKWRHYKHTSSDKTWIKTVMHYLKTERKDLIIINDIYK